MEAVHGLAGTGGVRGHGGWCAAAQQSAGAVRLRRAAGGCGTGGTCSILSAYLHDLMESGDLPDISARQESGGVQLMTIHKSKGLEFPVVILADLQKGFNRDDFQRPVLVHPPAGTGDGAGWIGSGAWYDTVSKQAIQLALSRESLAEEMRILYVAMTRAKGEADLRGLYALCTQPGPGPAQCGGLSCGAGGVGSAKAPGTGSCCRCCVRRRRRCFAAVGGHGAGAAGPLRWRLAGAAVGEPGV